MFDKIKLYFFTLWHMKTSQILFQVWNRLKKPTNIRANPYNCFELSETWNRVFGEKDTLVANKYFSFLNVREKVGFPIEWQPNDKSLLWTYNLHYFDFFNVTWNSKREKLNLEIFDDWLENNPVGYGVGWQPYPLSLRLVNIFKAALNRHEFKPEHIQSVYLQVKYLNCNLEKHLLGNHYLANLKALLFGGTIFCEDVWRNKAVKNLVTQIEEQFLPDGAHFERSPMYHRIMVSDMLDIYNLLKAYPDQETYDLKVLVEDKLQSMLSFARLVSHGDGGPSFFNDSCFDVAPSLALLENYAVQLGLQVPNQTNNCIYNLDSSGFLIASKHDAKLIMDVGDVGPKYIPGHAHAETLALELSIGQNRVIVNSGISTYDENELRLFQRGTRSHSTVEIDGRNSSEIWKSFRVARRARVIKRKVCDAETAYFVDVAHTGYLRWCQGPIHNRWVKFEKNRVEILDSIRGKFETAISRLYFAPDLQFESIDGTYKCIHEGIEINVEVIEGRHEILETKWYPRFGQNISNQCLLAHFEKDIVNIVINWKSLK